jgi:hypothetical protein
MLWAAPVAVGSMPVQSAEASAGSSRIEALGCPRLSPAPEGATGRESALLATPNGAMG